MSNSPTQTKIESYRNDVLQDKIACILPPCPTCHTMPDAFKRHEARSREFYVPVDQLIQEVTCLVIRWRCPGRKKTFTKQPPFAFPRKRYVLETILDLTGRYLEEDASTYRKVVLQDHMPIFHASSSEENTIDDRSLAHSTLYRWITGLGELKEILRSAQDLILQENPASAVWATLTVGARVSPVLGFFQSQSSWCSFCCERGGMLTNPAPFFNCMRIFSRKYCTHDIIKVLAVEHRILPGRKECLTSLQCFRRFPTEEWQRLPCHGW